MATLEDEYIKSYATGKISHRTSHNIAGDKDGNEHSHAHVRQPKLNFEPPDNKDTGNQPSGNQPDVNQPEWCAIA